MTQPAWVDELVAARDCSTDEEKVGLAVELARQNLLRGGGGPFGAVVFKRGESRPLAGGTNRLEPLRNSVLHAETVALMSAEAEAGTHELAGYELFSSCEPCAMCLGATFWARVDRVVFAALTEDAERVGFDEGPVFPESWRYLEERGIGVVAGLRREDGIAVLDLYAKRSSSTGNG